MVAMVAVVSSNPITRGMPDERWGEVPHAFVVLEAGATATETELRNYARDHLAHFKWLGYRRKCQILEI